MVSTPICCCDYFLRPEGLYRFDVDNSCEPCWEDLYIMEQIVEGRERWSEKDRISGCPLWG